MTTLCSSPSLPAKKKPLTEHIDEENTTTSTTPNWVALPKDVTATILSKFGTVEIMKRVEHVCSYWRSICIGDAFMWRTIHVDTDGLQDNLVAMCRCAVDRSRGQLHHIRLVGFATDPLLLHIAHNGSVLRSMQLLYCSSIEEEAFIKAIKKLPLLEELHISMFEENLKAPSLVAIGKYCPLLRSLKFRVTMFHMGAQGDNNDGALAIARNMPNLQHLMLTGNKLNDDGLVAILNACPFLQSIDIRYCYNVIFRVRGLRARCLEQINLFRFPNEDKKVVCLRCKLRGRLSCTHV